MTLLFDKLSLSTTALKSPGMQYLLRTGAPKRQKKHMIWPRKPLEANFAPTSASSGSRRKTRSKKTWYQALTTKMSARPPLWASEPRPMPRLFRPQDRKLNHRVHIQLLMVVTMNRQSPSAGTSPHQIRSTELLRKRNSKSFGQEANCMSFGA